MNNQPPIIDRAIFFDNPEISSGSLSPDGKHIAFLKAYQGIMNIYVKKFDEDFDKAKLLTESDSPILGFFWTFDSKNIIYVNDNHGDENYNIFKVDPLAKASKDHHAPPSSNLTPLDQVTAQIFMVSRKDPDLMIIGLNDRDKAWHDLYHLRISTGELKLMYTNNNRMGGWKFDWDENLRLVYRTAENGWQEILRVDSQTEFTKIFETNLKEQGYVTGWNEDSSKFYLVTNKGENDLTALYLCDPETGERNKIEEDPKGKVDFGSTFFDKNEKKLIFTAYVEDKTRYYWKDQVWEDDYTYLEEQFPDREISITSSTKDYQKWLVATGGDKYAGEVYFFDRTSRELILQYTPKPKLKEVESYLSEMTAISYASSDGMVIPGYLTLPKGKEAKNLPVIAFVHGGPKGPRDYWGYNGYVQFFANRGYAVLQPNFRASGGYGKEFLNAGDKEWGRKMQDDITWGIQYLIDKKIVDEKRVAILGGSYGGYATLAGLAFTPDLYTCGVDIVGPSNLFTLLESIPPYWESGRQWLYEMVGDPDTEEGKALLRERSPLFHSDNISKPLLIIQGANDPRVKQQESDQIVKSLHEKGKDVVYLNALDEGHGYRKPLNRMAMFAEIEKFLAKHLQGRYQADMPKDVEEKLKELEVNPAEVLFANA
jgi:dipeptidyl aminopeptidase/acylaminoacyl peptidase